MAAPSAEGEPREIFGVILDATDRHSLEEQLAQARKMEAVGRAHGRRRPRLQQPAHRGARQHRHHGQEAGGRGPPRPPHRCGACQVLAERTRPHSPAPGLLAPPAPVAGQSQRERADQRLYAAVAPGGRRSGDPRSQPGARSAVRPRRPHAAGNRPAEPGGERPGRDAGRRSPRHPDPPRRSACDHRGQRHRRRHDAGGARAGVRALLHHQGGGQGLGPGPLPGLRLRPPVRRRYSADQHAGAGHQLRPALAGLRRAGGKH